MLLCPLQVALNVAAAAKNAKQATDAVGRTLRDINALLDNLGKTLEFACVLKECIFCYSSVIC